MVAPTARRHETRAMLRAHLAAASGYRHLTRHCPICHRLLRLAMEAEGPPGTVQGPGTAAESVAVLAPRPASTPVGTEDTETPCAPTTAGRTREAGALPAPRGALEPKAATPWTEAAQGPVSAVSTPRIPVRERVTPSAPRSSAPGAAGVAGTGGPADAVRAIAAPGEPAGAEDKGPPSE